MTLSCITATDLLPFLPSWSKQGHSLITAYADEPTLVKYVIIIIIIIKRQTDTDYKMKDWKKKQQNWQTNLYLLSKQGETVLPFLLYHSARPVCE